MRSLRNISIIVAIVFLGLFLDYSCAADEREDKERIQKRVEDYYEAFRNGNYDILYKMEHQAIKKIVTKDDYIKIGKKNLEENPLSIESIGKITIKEKTIAEVQLFINVFYESKKREGEIKDIWVYENGDWYHAPN